MTVLVLKSVAEFIESFDRNTRTKVERLIDLLKEYGHEIGMPYSRSLRDGVFELRIRGKREIRLLYGYSETGAIIVIGFIKKTQQTPQKEIEKAKILLNKL